MRQVADNSAFFYNPRGIREHSDPHAKRTIQKSHMPSTVYNLALTPQRKGPGEGRNVLPPSTVAYNLDRILPHTIHFRRNTARVDGNLPKIHMPMALLHSRAMGANE
jgi:hypothetical protein